MKILLSPDQLVHCLRYVYQYKEESATLRNTQVWCIHSIICLTVNKHFVLSGLHRFVQMQGYLRMPGELNRWMRSPIKVASPRMGQQLNIVTTITGFIQSGTQQTIIVSVQFQMKPSSDKIINLYMSGNHCGLLVLPHPSWNWSNQEEPGVFITPNSLHVIYGLIVFGMTHWQASSKFVSHRVCVKLACFVCISKLGTQ